MTWGILPVKSPRESMQRLSAVLSERERETLALTMYQEMLAKLLAAGSLDAVAVASSDSRVLDHARRAGTRVFPEARQVSHSRSADWAAVECTDLGARTVLLLPIDVPLATSGEINALAKAAVELGPRGLVIVPSEDGTGSNALAKSPPNVIESRFGPGSFEAHAEQARRQDVPLRAERIPGLVFDVDTPADLVAFMRRAKDGPTLEYLWQIDAEERAERYCRSNAARAEAR